MAVLNQILFLKKYKKKLKRPFFYHFSHFKKVSITWSTVLRPVRSFFELTWVKCYILSVTKKSDKLSSRKWVLLADAFTISAYR